MSKKRKTKKEKMQASARHQFTNVITFGEQHIQLSPIQAVSENIPPTKTIHTLNDYSYVTTDVRKTVFVTSVLLGINVVIFFLLKLSIITIPGIVF